MPRASVSQKEIHADKPMVERAYQSPEGAHVLSDSALADNGDRLYRGIALDRQQETVSPMKAVTLNNNKAPLVGAENPKRTLLRRKTGGRGRRSLVNSGVGSPFPAVKHRSHKFK